MTLTDIAAYRIDEARKAHERGWVLTPLNGKKPRLKSWQVAPLSGLTAVESWARDGNIGLRTGSASGIVVIDEDRSKGGSVKSLDLPETVTVETGGDGRHYYFKAPDGGLGNSTGRLAPHVDVRADRGQVVYPGSVHPETGEAYRWEEGFSPDEIKTAELPSRVLEMLRARDPPGIPVSPSFILPEAGRTARYGECALKRACQRVSTAPEGVRNHTLNLNAFQMGQLLGATTLDSGSVMTHLTTAAMEAGLLEREARATIHSGLRAGIEQPKAVRTSGRYTSVNNTIAPQLLPEIMIVDGKLPEVVQQAEEALLSQGVEIYQRGGALVHIVSTTDTSSTAGIHRAAGTPLIRVAQQAFLVECMTGSAVWKKFDGRLRKDREIDCPDRVAKTLLARGEWRVPHLLGILGAPTLRPDGTLLREPGYDRATGLYLTGCLTDIEVPERPTQDHARDALESLNGLLQGFPWVSGSDRSAALAAILTSLIRPALSSAPLFAFRAPDGGTGKSLLADVVAMIATGRVASVMSQGHSEEEDKKRILAILMAGGAVNSIDNVDRPLGGATLCAVLTQDSYQDRELGRSRMVKVPTSTTWLATGNNMVIEGDLTSRVIPCDLDARCERPGERTFELNLREYVPKNRARLVTSALIILRAYCVAGRPDQGLPVFGRFEGWSDWVRSALVWCGEADPCDGRHRIEDEDPVRRRLRAVLHGWRDEIGPREVTVKEAIAQAGQAVLAEHFAEIAAHPNGSINTRRLGNWLSAHQNRIEDGLRIVRRGERQGVATWKVCQV